MTANGTSKVAQVAKATQTCNGCGKTKPLADFPPHPKTPLGVFKRCETCLSERQQVVQATRRKAEDEVRTLRARARRREADQMTTDAKAILDEHNLPALDAALTGEQVTDLYGTARTSLQLGRDKRGIEKVGARDRHFLYRHRSIIEAYRDGRLGKPRARQGVKNRSAAKIAGYRERISAAVSALEAQEAAERAEAREAKLAARQAEQEQAEAAVSHSAATPAEVGLAPPATPSVSAGGRAAAPAGKLAFELAVLAGEARGAAMIDDRFTPLAERLSQLADRELGRPGEDA